MRHVDTSYSALFSRPNGYNPNCSDVWMLLGIRAQYSSIDARQISETNSTAHILVRLTADLVARSPTHEPLTAHGPFKCCNTSEREFSCARVLRMCLPNASTFTNIGISVATGTDGIVCVFALRTHTFRYTCVHRPLSCALTFVGTSSKVAKSKDTKR